MKNNKIQHKKDAFTLAETLVVLTIIGVLAVIALSVLQKSVPDKNKALFKKAYSVTERTIAELVNDENFYPYDPDRIGFLNTDVVQIPGTTSAASGDTKLCELFTNKLNLLGDIAYEDSNCVFETTDGIFWTMPVGVSDFATRKTITVDVNGRENLPNSDDVDNPERDIFSIHIYSDGRVNVSGPTEIEWLKSHDVKK